MQRRKMPKLMVVISVPLHLMIQKGQKKIIQLPTYPRQMFDDCIAKSLIEKVQGKEFKYEKEKPQWYRCGSCCGYDQVTGHYTNSCVNLKKILKYLLQKNMIEYKDEKMIKPTTNQYIHQSMNMVIHGEEEEAKEDSSSEEECNVAT